MSNAIQVEEFVKALGPTRALDGIDLQVPEATVAGLLGPNGSGKTTAVRILATLLRPTAGRALVAGYDVTRQRRRCARSSALPASTPRSMPTSLRTSATRPRIRTGMESPDRPGIPQRSVPPGRYMTNFAFICAPLAIFASPGLFGIIGVFLAGLGHLETQS